MIKLLETIPVTNSFNDYESWPHDKFDNFLMSTSEKDKFYKNS